MHFGCPHCTSCGISTSFPMLFRTQRQVAHALLTRPPLTFIRSKLPNQSVRLECVMHAASVYPEPGSNSLKKYLSHSLWVTLFLRCLSCSNLMFWLSHVPFRNTETLLSLSCFRNCTSILFLSRLSLFNFQGTFLNSKVCLFRWELVYYITTDSLCQAFFSKFTICLLIQALLCFRSFPRQLC